jgi:hypothetical protein
MAASFWKLQEYVRKGQLEIDVIPTKRQIADFLEDFFTKTKITARRFRDLERIFCAIITTPTTTTGYRHPHGR